MAQDVAAAVVQAAQVMDMAAVVETTAAVAPARLEYQRMAMGFLIMEMAMAGGLTEMAMVEDRMDLLGGRLGLQTVMVAAMAAPTPLALSGREEKWRPI